MKRIAALMLTLALLPFAAEAACVVCGPDSTRECPGIQAHRCLSLHFGSAHPDEDGSPHYAGFRLGLFHSALSRDDVLRTVVSERCGLTGASLQLLTDLNAGPLTGASACLLFSDWTDVRGFQLSGLMTHADRVRGAQFALLMNRTESAFSGFQFGLVNIAGSLRGVQIGLLNINRDGRTLPLINIGF